MLPVLTALLVILISGMQNKIFRYTITHVYSNSSIPVNTHKNECNVEQENDVQGSRVS